MNWVLRDDYETTRVDVGLWVVHSVIAIGDRMCYQCSWCIQFGK